jgi:hypothetical protein
MPYESIEEKEYDKQVKKLGKLSFGVIHKEEANIEKFCDGDFCDTEVVSTTGDNDDQEYAN